MEDEVNYQFPLEPLSLVALPPVRRQVEHIFDYREKVISELPREKSFTVALC
jgi:hypothetical protein